MANYCSNQITVGTTNSEWNEIETAFNNNNIDWPISMDGTSCYDRTISCTTKWTPTPWNEGKMAQLSESYPSALFYYTTDIEGEYPENCPASWFCNGQEINEAEKDEVQKKEISKEADRFLNANPRAAKGIAGTIAIMPDGRVASDGENRFGECNIFEWENIAQISCGNWHTVGLKSDGSVVACGSNTNGQCEVDNLPGRAKMVSCGRYHTAILLENGQVIVKGKLEQKPTFESRSSAYEFSLDEFPITHEMTLNKYIDGWEQMNARIENMSNGDPVILKPAIRKYEDSYEETYLEVFNTKGEKIGELWTHLAEGIAKYIDNVVAVAEVVKPLSTRRKNSKYAYVSLNIDYKDADQGTNDASQNNNEVGEYQQTRIGAWPAVEKILSVYDAVAGITKDGKVYVSGYCPCTVKALTSVLKNINIEVVDEQPSEDFNDGCSRYSFGTDMSLTLSSEFKFVEVTDESGIKKLTVSKGEYKTKSGKNLDLFNATMKYGEVTFTNEVDSRTINQMEDSEIDGLIKKAVEDMAVSSLAGIEVGYKTELTGKPYCSIAYHSGPISKTSKKHQLGYISIFAMFNRTCMWRFDISGIIGDTEQNRIDNFLRDVIEFAKGLSYGEMKLPERDLDLGTLKSEFNLENYKNTTDDIAVVEEVKITKKPEIPAIDNKKQTNTSKQTIPASAPKKNYKKLTDIVSCDNANERLFVINDQWSFELPSNIFYALDADYEDGLNGISLAGNNKPMVLSGFGGVLNVALAPYYDFFGNFGTVIDCKYDNRITEDGPTQRRILHDTDSLFVDLVANNQWPMGVFVDLRIRGDEIIPFNFNTRFEHSMDEHDQKRVMDVLKEIGKSIKLLGEEKTNKPKKTTSTITDPNFIIEGTVARKYIGCDDNIIFPEGITDIADNICSGKTNIKTVYIPDGVKYVGSRSFENCFELDEVRLPDSVKEIGHYAFVDCHELRKINLGKNLKCLPSSIFSECFVLENVKIPNKVKMIDAFAFKNCRAFTSIVIPNGCEYIGTSAFYSCANLEYLYIPKSVTTILDDFLGETPFGNCPKLTIHTPAGSAAQSYCREHGINCVADDKPAHVADAVSSLSGATEENTWRFDYAALDRFEEVEKQLKEMVDSTGVEQIQNAFEGAFDFRECVAFNMAWIAVKDLSIFYDENVKVLEAFLERYPLTTSDERFPLLRDANYYINIVNKGTKAERYESLLELYGHDIKDHNNFWIFGFAVSQLQEYYEFEEEIIAKYAMALMNCYVNNNCETEFKKDYMLKLTDSYLDEINRLGKGEMIFNLNLNFEINIVTDNEDEDEAEEAEEEVTTAEAIETIAEEEIAESVEAAESVVENNPTIQEEKPIVHRWTSNDEGPSLPKEKSDDPWVSVLDIDEYDDFDDDDQNVFPAVYQADAPPKLIKKVEPENESAECENIEEQSTTVGENNKKEEKTEEKTEKKKSGCLRALGVSVAAIVGLFLLICIIGSTGSTTSATWDFDIDDSKSFVVNGLTCYCPSDWACGNYDDGDGYSYLSAEVLNFDVYCYGEASSKSELIDLLEEDPGLDEDDYTEIDITGCDYAVESEYKNDEDTPVYMNAVICDGYIFGFYFVADDEIYKVKEFKEMMECVDFEGFEYVRDFDEVYDLSETTTATVHSLEVYLPKFWEEVESEDDYFKYEYSNNNGEVLIELSAKYDAEADSLEEYYEMRADESIEPQYSEDNTNDIDVENADESVIYLSDSDNDSERDHIIVRCGTSVFIFEIYGTDDFFDEDGFVSIISESDFDTYKKNHKKETESNSQSTRSMSGTGGGGFIDDTLGN